MSKTITFSDKANKAVFVVKESFLELCPEPATQSLGELVTKFNIPAYYHNERGPAVVSEVKNIEEYWIDGVNIKLTDPALEERMKSEYHFNNKFNEFVNAEDDSSDSAKTE